MQPHAAPTTRRLIPLLAGVALAILLLAAFDRPPPAATSPDSATSSGQA